MPRRPIPPNSTHPYHVTARAHNREAFAVEIGAMWTLLQDYLYLTNKLYALRIHSFVLMPNHFHLLVTAPSGNLSEAMNYFMREAAREVSRVSKRINQTFGARHHKSLIENSHYFFNAYKYVYRNPVRAGLANSVESYRFSTLGGLLGFQPLVIPLIEDTILFPDGLDVSVLKWLNTSPDLDREDETRRALKRPFFKYSKRGRKESALETCRL